MKRHLFKRHSGRGSYDLFSNYSCFVPGVTDMIWMTVLFFAGAFIGGAMMTALQVWISQDFAFTYGMVMIYPLQFIPMMLYASVKSRLNAGFGQELPLDSNDFGDREGWFMALTVSLMAIAAAFVIEPISMMLPEMSEEVKALMEKLMNGPVWLVLISVSIFAPFFEEWLCRGIILRGLIDKTGPAWAIVISAAVFGLIHGNLWQAIPAFFIGCLLGYVYYRTGSLKLTMLMHCVNNTLAVAVSRIPGLQDAEFFADVMSPWAYVSAIILFAIALTGGIAVISTTGPAFRKKDS